MSAAFENALERLEGIGGVIADHALESEQAGQLAPAVVDALHDAGTFRVLVPAELGGSGLTIPEAIELFERAASFDASTAWTMGILADGAIFARFLSSSAFEEIYSDPKALMAGTLNPATAQAERVDGGYRFTGKATYLSGSAHAQCFLAAAVVTQDGLPDTSGGGFAIRTGVIPIEAATNLETWTVTGMKATGSNDWAFEGVEVDEGWTFDPLAPKGPVEGDPFAVIPLWAQLGGGLASIPVGTARNMIDRFCEMALGKIPTGGDFSHLAERAGAQAALGEADGLYQAARATLLKTVDDVWQQGLAERPFSNEDVARARLGTVTASRLAVQAIDLIHDAAGMNAITSDTVMDRCWRDVHTMTQHIMLAPPRLEIAGRVLLGQDPGTPVI